MIMKYLSFFAALLFSIAVSANTTTGEPPFVLKVEHQSLKKDGEHVLEFRAANTKSLIGYQFAIELSEELEFVEVIPGEIPDLSKNNFGTQKASEGLIFTNWFSGNQRVFVEDELIFSIKVNVKKVVSTADAVIINHQKMASEVYKLNGEHFGVELIFSKNTNSKTSEMMVFQTLQKMSSRFILRLLKVNQLSC